MVEPAPAEAGFTLLELLVTLSLLGLLTMVMFGGMRFGVQAWARTGTGLTEANAARKAEDLIKTDLSHAYPLYSSSGTKASVAFSGEEHRIAYLTSSRDTPGMMERVVLEARGDGEAVDLVRTEAPELARTNENRQKQLMSHLHGVTFSYYGAEQDDQKPAWSNSWQNRTRLPTLIQVAIEAKNGTETFLVAPRLAADAGCVFDALTKRCRGR